MVATEEEDLVERVMAITGGKGARDRVRPGRRALCRDAGEGAAPRGILFIYGGLSEQPTPYPHWQCAFKGLSMRGWVASEIWNHPHRYKRGAGEDPRRACRRPSEAGDREGVPRPRAARASQRIPQSNQQVGKVVVMFLMPARQQARYFAAGSPAAALRIHLLRSAHRGDAMRSSMTLRASLPCGRALRGLAPQLAAYR